MSFLFNLELSVNLNKTQQCLNSFLKYLTLIYFDNLADNHENNNWYHHIICIFYGLKFRY